MAAVVVEDTLVVEDIPAAAGVGDSPAEGQVEKNIQIVEVVVFSAAVVDNPVVAVVLGTLAVAVAVAEEHNHAVADIPAEEASVAEVVVASVVVVVVAEVDNLAVELSDAVAEVGNPAVGVSAVAAVGVSVVEQVVVRGVGIAVVAVVVSADTAVVESDSERIAAGEVAAAPVSQAVGRNQQVDCKDQRNMAVEMSAENFAMVEDVAPLEVEVSVANPVDDGQSHEGCYLESLVV